MTPSSPTPSLPRLTLRVAVVGARRLDDDARAFVERAWGDLARTMAGSLTRILASRGPSGVARFYASDARPLLRVITGLAEGTDDTISAGTRQLALASVDVELAAVLPAEVLEYRASRAAEYHATFDAHVAACRYVVALDGLTEKPVPDTPVAVRRRARSYRAQAAVILRQADLVVIAADPSVAGRPGGSMETVQAALARDLPVVFMDLARRGLWLLEPFHDLAAALAADPLPVSALHHALDARLERLLIDPDLAAGSGRGHGEEVLEEYFHHQAVPPMRVSADGVPSRVPTRRERLWRWFERRFAVEDAALARETPLAPVQMWRQRATQLNYHYAGLYRGAYLMNYGLAVLAVTLAAVSLVLLGQQHIGAVAVVDPSAREAEVATWSTLHLVLLGLALLKCAIVVTIARNTHQANHGDWNDRLVDYRYLAERLRAMFYLPLVGSFEPPSAAPPQYASRVVRQSAVDWLLEAILRSVDPAAFATRVAVRGINGNLFDINLLRPDAAAGARRLRDQWIAIQAAYHDRTARTMDALHRFLDTWGRRLNMAVIVFVVIDIGLTVGELLHLYPEPLAKLVSANMPWLVFLAAVLPAAVAGLNAIRFQSECRRLADRSAVIRTILQGRDSSRPGGRLLAVQELITQMERAQRDPSTDPASWVAEVLRVTEAVARDSAEEVGEWSVLYAKELPEP